MPSSKSFVRSTFSAMTLRLTNSFPHVNIGNNSTFQISRQTDIYVGCSVVRVINFSLLNLDYQMPR